MDAHALLTSQGWRGTGHSLHSTSDTIGLSRPILVSQKQNTLGVGKKQHKTSDMWWMNAFDKTLKGLETTEQGDGTARVVQTNTSGGLELVVGGGGKYVGNAGGLYASFVRGEGLVGTLGVSGGEEVVEGVSNGEAILDLEALQSKKRKRGSDMETKEERRARKAAKRAAKAEIDSEDQAQISATATSDEAVDESLPSGETESETKEQRRERRRLKKLRKEEEKEARKEESKKSIDTEDSSEKKKKKKRRKEEKV